MSNAMIRFLAKVNKEAPNGCWLWVGAISNNGYGKFHGDDARTWNAHRWAFQHIGGQQLVSGLTLDHLCRTRACVNPAHLEQVTSEENIRRGAAGQIHAQRQRAKTHCARGHAFTADNTAVDSRGWRRCLECARANTRESMRRLRATRVGVSR